MAARGGSGLGAGGVALVSIGFVAASVVVFVFGIWVGKDLAERRLAQEERVVRGAVVRLTPTSGAARDSDVASLEQLRDVALRPSVTGTPGSRGVPTVTPTATAVPRPPMTKTAPAIRATPTAPGRRDPKDEWADAGWTVQVIATTDAAEAGRVSARLKAKGHDAYVIRVPLRGQDWHRVRVGNFGGRENAGQLANQLKAEGWADAFITSR